MIGRDRPLVYVAGPYSSPDPCANTHEAIAVADRISAFCWPLIPHLSHFWHTMSPKPYEFWTEHDFVLLARCDALLRFPGESPGADAEVGFSYTAGIPVFTDEAELRKWCES